MCRIGFSLLGMDVTLGECTGRDGRSQPLDSAGLTTYANTGWERGQLNIIHLMWRTAVDVENRGSPQGDISTDPIKCMDR